MGMEDKAVRSKKKEQLGMNHGTAANKLRKIILFALVKEAGLDNCYRCGERIERVEDLSIEHKIPWLDSDDPKGLYFDLNNIAFSHLSCNSSAARYTTEPKEYPPLVGPEGEIYPAGKNLASFCREHGLNSPSMYEVVSGKRKSYKGFKRIN